MQHFVAILHNFLAAGYFSLLILETLRSSCWAASHCITKIIQCIVLLMQNSYLVERSGQIITFASTTYHLKFTVENTKSTKRKEQRLVKSSDTKVTNMVNERSSQKEHEEF